MGSRVPKVLCVSHTGFGIALFAIARLHDGSCSGQGGGDRTHDFLIPNQARYLCATPWHCHADEHGRLRCWWGDEGKHDGLQISGAHAPVVSTYVS